MHTKVMFAMDKNLELPIKDPVWEQFFLKFGIAPALYTDMAKLTEKLKENTTLLSYIPTANLFYIRSDPYYTPIANAIFSMSSNSKISSLLVVAKKSPIQTLAQLKGKALGYIHPFCTTSYFSPALLLWRNHFSIHKFFSLLKQVGAWQSQIEAVISGEVDATMVSEDVWLKLPRNAELTKIIAREENLPCPLIVVGKGIDKTLLKELKEILFSYKPIAHSKDMFNGFIPYQKEQTEKFFSESEQAFAK
jgi:phosphonate transport system substrate-binding protein